jgi:hypothetical protein
MKAQVGDELVVKGRHVGDPDRTRVIIEVIGQAGGPPYLVRWSDGHEIRAAGGTLVVHGRDARNLRMDWPRRR